MPATYTLIASNTLSSSAASVTFSSIPATFTDLVLRFSVRSTAAGVIGGSTRITFNGSSATNYSDTVLNVSYASTISSFRNSDNSYFDPNIGQADSAGNTANTFGTVEVYIPSYTVSQNKPIGSFAVSEQNSTGDYSISAQAALWRVTSAITSLTITEPSANFAAGSSFFLYGIKNS